LLVVVVADLQKALAMVVAVATHEDLLQVAGSVAYW
jgi:hypothetical protein